MTLYEEGSNSIDAQIELWSLIRKEYVYCYYGRKEGYKNFGLQPLPALAVCEYKAKEAIQMVLLLKSLKKSQYGGEEWSLSSTSAELLYTAPRNTFKKFPYVVDVHFDNTPQNSFPYTNWDALYIQDENDQWYKTPGLVDIDGLYYEDKDGVKNYFVVFAADAQRYGTTGQWTVHYKNETLFTSASITSSLEPLSGSVQGSVKEPVTSSWDAPSTSKASGRKEAEEGKPSSTTSFSPLKLRRRRGGGEQQGERRPKRRRAEETSVGVSASEVGGRHTSVPRTGLTRVRRLEAEARDPPIILVKGGANNLKCWRNRCKKSNALFWYISTVFRWADNNAFHSFNHHRMLIAFRSNAQRDLFLATVSLPKNTTYALGSLDSL